jgi:hypothetical protein
MILGLFGLVVDVRGVLAELDSKVVDVKFDELMSYVAPSSFS